MPVLNVAGKRSRLTRVGPLCTSFTCAYSAAGVKLPRLFWILFGGPLRFCVGVLDARRNRVLRCGPRARRFHVHAVDAGRLPGFAYVVVEPGRDHGAARWHAGVGALRRPRAVASGGSRVRPCHAHSRVARVQSKSTRASAAAICRIDGCPRAASWESLWLRAFLYRNTRGLHRSRSLVA
jgi:hypothetical protein